MQLPLYYEYGSRVRIIAGLAALEKIPDLLQQWSAQRPLLVTDKGVSAAGMVERVAEALSPTMGLGPVVDSVSADADEGTVNRLVQVFREAGCDAILAVGGGSVLDTAKTANIAISQGADDGSRSLEAGLGKRPLKPLIAIPTTAGSGAEVSPTGWISARPRLVKGLSSSNFFLPHIAVLDPRMTLTLPPHVTAATAMEALSHAIEAYTCLAKNPISDAQAFSAIRMISENLFHVIQHPDEPNGRLALAVAACLAGLALSNATGGMVHALADSLADRCRVPHGNCLAILLPFGLEFNMHKNSRLTAELLLPLVGAPGFAESPYHLRAERVVGVIRAFNQGLHELTGGRHPRCLKEIRGPDDRALVPESALTEIAMRATSHGASFGNPEEMDGNDALTVLRHAWEGLPLDTAQIVQG